MARHVRDGKREAFWRGVLKRFAKSGLRVRAFCQLEQIGEASFYAWRRTIAERDVEVKRSRRPAFLPVVVSDSQRGDQAITIELAGGRRLRLPESMTTERLVELVAALEAQAAR